MERSYKSFLVAESSLCGTGEAFCFLFFFFLMMRPPPRSTLFPYTTLFRSERGRRLQQRWAARRRRHHRRPLPQGVRGRRAVGPPRHRGPRLRRERHADRPQGRDRRARAHDALLPDVAGMTGGVDLHAHTTASDGTLSPRELVSAAARRGVRVLAVTDHESTDGLRDAVDEAAKHPPLTIVPGLEINCDAPGAAGAEVHVLGYYVDHEAGWFQDFWREQRVERVARVHRIAARLAELGMPIDSAEVFAIVKEGSAGRPHVAQVMVQRGYVRSVREAFDRYLHANGPANVPRKHLTPAEAVRIIRRAHGVPGFAHPGLAD